MAPRTASKGGQKKPKEIKVLLTGYGSFSRITDNPSWGIVASFLASSEETTTTTTKTTLSIPGHTITIVAHPEALRVSYSFVDALVPVLWEEEQQDWDYILHLGVGLEGGFQLETRAWEKGYKLKDVDGLIPDAAAAAEMKAVEMKAVHGSEDKNAAKGEGRVLTTTLDVPWIVGLVKECVTAVEDQQPVDIVTSDNPGMYLCGYIFRASLLEAEKRGDKWRKRVAFLHVPPEGKKYGVQTGREVVLKIVEGMVRDGEGVRQ